MRKYFEYPMQVSFYDVETGRFLNGIAYRDEIICLECGGVIQLFDLYRDAKENGIDTPLTIYPEWCDISEYCD